MHYVADLNDVINKGRLTMQLTENQFEEIINKHNVSKGFDAFRVPCCRLVKIWEELKLPYMSMYLGYSEKDHLLKIKKMRQVEQS